MGALELGGTQDHNDYYLHGKNTKKIKNTSDTIELNLYEVSEGCEVNTGITEVGIWKEIIKSSKSIM